MTQYTYLIINILTISIPLFLSFEKKVRYFSKWKSVLVASLIVAVPFIIWDYIFTKYGVWEFNPQYTTGLTLLNLPIEEVMFFFTVPFACLFLYECIKYYTHERLNSTNKSVYVLPLIPTIFILIYSITSSLIYTSVVFFFFTLLWFSLILNNKIYRSSYYWLYILFSLLGFLIVNSLLTSLPVVIYDTSQILNLRIFSIPIEDFIYFFLMNTLVFWIYITLVSRDISDG
jgi:lycopene cyclase domain-containing protein